MPAPQGYVDTAEAVTITGVHRLTLTEAAGRGEIPGAIQRKRKAPWYFTVAGLRSWMGVRDEQPAGVAS